MFDLNSEGDLDHIYMDKYIELLPPINLCLLIKHLCWTNVPNRVTGQCMFSSLASRLLQGESITGYFCARNRSTPFPKNNQPKCIKNSNKRISLKTLLMLCSPGMDHFSVLWRTKSIWCREHEFLQQTPMTNHKQKWVASPSLPLIFL